MAYAETTTVPFERSISEIVKMVRDAGADQVGQMEESARYAVQFTLSDRMVRFAIPFPALDDMPKHDGRGRNLTGAQRTAKLEQAKRQRGRALMLVIKAKLESIESGIETFEQAFLANIVMSDGRTVYDRAQPAIAQEYSTGRPTMALLGGPTGADQ